MCSFKIWERERETVFLRKWQNEKLLETAIRITPAHGFSSSSLHSAHSCFLGGFALSAPTEILHWCFPSHQVCRAALISPLQGSPGWHRAPTLGSAHFLSTQGPKPLSREITTFQPFTSFLPQSFLPFAILSWSINSCVPPHRGLEWFSH